MKRLIIKLMRRWVFIVCSSVLISFSQTAQAASQIDDVTIPKDLGLISQRITPPNTNEPTPVLFLIQDAHMNESSQRNIASILDHLGRTYGLRLILVEGGAGDAGLAFLRDYASPEGRMAIAEEYLKKGMIAGHEYLDIVSDEPWILWGVEEPAAYHQNFEAFLSHSGLKKDILPLVKQLREDLEPYQGERLSAPVLQVIAQQAAFDDGQFDVTEWVLFLIEQIHTEQAQAAGVTIANYPNLERYQGIQEFESNWDKAVFVKQQRQVIQDLAVKVSEKGHDHLMSLLQNRKAKKIDMHTFLQELEVLMAVNNVSLAEQAPQVKTYLTHLKDKAELDTMQFIRELSHAAYDLKMALTQTTKEKAFVLFLDRLERMERLFALKWTPQDDLLYLPDPESFQLVPYALQVPEVYEPHREVIVAADTAFDKAYAFYRAADGRNRPMVLNSVQKMADEGASVAALVAGGFHTHELTRLFAKQGVSVIVVTPHVSGSTDEDWYHFMLKAKYKDGQYLKSE